MDESGFHDEYEAVIFAESAGRALDDIRKQYPALYGRILQDIHLHLTAWVPDSEDGRTIKHVSKLSTACQRGIYRLKSPPTIPQWRIFFTYLDGKRPPQRLVLAMVKYESEQQCYNDMAQPHMREIRRIVLDASTRGDFKRRR